MRPIRVLIADDHPMLLEALAAELRRQRMDVVGEIEHAGEILPAFERTLPDIAVLDIAFAEATRGLDVAAEILGRHPAARIVFYSQYDSGELIRAAYRAGCLAFVPKNRAKDVLVDAIRRAHGEPRRPHLLPDIAEALALMDLGRADSERAALTDREKQVFRMIAQGLSSAEISLRLSLSAKTVSSITQAVKAKLGVTRSVDIARLAAKQGIV